MTQREREPKEKVNMAMVALTHAHTQSPLKKTKAWHHLSFYMPSITDPFLSLKGVKKKRTFVSLKLCILRLHL
jgi:hypothetical protein